MYVFTRPSGTSGSWSRQSTLTARDGCFGDAFGTSIAASDDGYTALIGASNKAPAHGQGPCGAAYVFTRAQGTWQQWSELTAADRVANDAFGTAVALSAGTTAVVGDFWQNSVQGAAYVFTRPNSASSTWTHASKLTAADGAPGDWFGGIDSPERRRQHSARRRFGQRWSRRGLRVCPFDRLGGTGLSRKICAPYRPLRYSPRPQSQRPCYAGWACRSRCIALRRQRRPTCAPPCCARFHRASAHRR